MSEQFICPVDGQVFPTYWELIIHMMTQHPGYSQCPNGQHWDDTAKACVADEKVFDETYREAEKYLRENMFMLLMGLGYSSLLGLSMYQSYDWSR